MLVFPHWRPEFPTGGCRVPQWMPVERFAPYLARPVPLPPLPPQLEDEDTSGGSSPERADDPDGVCGWRGCGADFHNIARLSAHIARTHAHAHSDGLFYCGWKGCARPQRGFNARYKMLVHVRTHTNERPHTCEQCQKSFSRAENLKIHMRSHSGEKPYVCPYEGCGKAYSNSSDRFKHTRTHAVEKPYYCKVAGCNKRYTDPSSLRKHVKAYMHFTTEHNRRELSDSDTLSPKEYERTSPSHARTVYERTSPIHERIQKRHSPIHVRISQDRTSPIHARRVQERSSIHETIIPDYNSPIHARLIQERTLPIHKAIVPDRTSPIHARLVQERTSPIRTRTVLESTSPIREIIIPEHTSPIHAEMINPQSLSPNVKIEDTVRYSPIEQVTYVRPKPLYPIRVPTDEMSYIEYSQMQTYRNYYSNISYPVIRPTVNEKVHHREEHESMSFMKEESSDEDLPLNLICNKRLECRPIEELVRRTDLPLDLSTKS